MRRHGEQTASTSWDRGLGQTLPPDPGSGGTGPADTLTSDFLAPELRGHVLVGDPPPPPSVSFVAAAPELTQGISDHVTSEPLLGHVPQEPILARILLNQSSPNPHNMGSPMLSHQGPFSPPPGNTGSLEPASCKSPEVDLTRLFLTPHPLSHFSPWDPTPPSIPGCESPPLPCRIQSRAPSPSSAANPVAAVPAPSLVPK